MGLEFLLMCLGSTHIYAGMYVQYVNSLHLKRLQMYRHQLFVFFFFWQNVFKFFELKLTALQILYDC